MLQIDRVCEYKGVVYKVISDLDNDLLLVVNKKDLDEGKFPLNPVIVPDEWRISQINQMK